MSKSDPKLDTYGERLSFLMHLRGIKEAEDLARVLRRSGSAITGSALSQVLSGKTKMLNAVNHSRVCSILHCDPLWLACREGSPPTNYEEGAADKVIPVAFADPNIERVVELMRATDARGRSRCIEAVARALATYKEEQTPNTKLRKG